MHFEVSKQKLLQWEAQGQVQIQPRKIKESPHGLMGDRRQALTLKEGVI